VVTVGASTIVQPHLLDTATTTTTTNSQNRDRGTNNSSRSSSSNKGVYTDNSTNSTSEETHAEAAIIFEKIIRHQDFEFLEYFSTIRNEKDGDEHEDENETSESNYSSPFSLDNLIWNDDHQGELELELELEANNNIHSHNENHLRRGDNDGNGNGSGYNDDGDGDRLATDQKLRLLEERGDISEFRPDSSSTSEDDSDDFGDELQPTYAPTFSDSTESPTVIGSSIFEDLDKYNQTYENENKTNTNLTAAYNPDGILNLPPNSIVLHISLAIVHYEHLTWEEKANIVTMAIRTMTVVLNEYQYQYEQDREHEHGGDGNRHNSTSNEYKDVHSTGAGGLPLVIDDHEALQEYYGRRKERQHQRILDPNSAEQTDDQREEKEPEPKRRWVDSIPNTTINEHEHKHHVAKLVLHNVTIHFDDPNWWDTSVIYTVWRKPRSFRQRDLGDSTNNPKEQQQQPKPHQTSRAVVEDDEYLEMFNIRVLNDTILRKIKAICRYAIDDSIKRRLYRKAWQDMDLDFGAGNLMDLILKHKPYCPYEKGMSDVRAPGYEYDVKQFYCTEERSKNNHFEGKCQKCYPMLRPIENEDLPVGEDFVPPIPTYPSPIAGSPLEIEWTTREWVGLGIMVSTTLLVGILSLIAHFESKQRSRNSLWKAGLTQKGVDELLQVGWRIHEGRDNNSQQQQFQQPQLFLQIYDKGIGPGYNDENSVLQGGVEQQQFFVARSRNPVAPSVSTTAPTNTTPP